MAALSDSACSRRLLCRRLRTSSSRAALSAFSWGEVERGGSQRGQPLAPLLGQPCVTPHDPQPPCHLLQVILQLPEHGLQVRDLLRQAPGFWPENMGFRTQ